MHTEGTENNKCNAHGLSSGINIADISSSTMNPVLRGTCTFKSDLKVYRNIRSEGTVFNFQITDESSSIILKDLNSAAKQISDKVEENQSYVIKGWTT